MGRRNSLSGKEAPVQHEQKPVPQKKGGKAHSQQQPRHEQKPQSASAKGKKGGKHSRGSRIRQLLGEEAEADAAFWGQAAWQEDASDGDYSTEEEEEDEVDADFDDDEAPDEDVHGEEQDERPRRRQKRQTGAYREPAARPKRPRIEALKAAEQPQQQDEQLKQQDNEQLRKQQEPSTATLGGPRVRSSTARKSSEALELRRRASEEAARAAARTKRPPVDKASARLSQAQLLAEAVRVEVENTQSLNRLEQLEEEKKAEAAAPKARFAGQMVRVYSRGGAPKTVTFLNSSAFPPIFNQPKPKKRVATQVRLEQMRRAAEQEQLTDGPDGSVDGDDEHAEPGSAAKKPRAPVA